MRKLIISEFITLDGVIQAPGAVDEDTDGGFAHGGWVARNWDDGIGAGFSEVIADVDAVLLGRFTYVEHAEAFEPNPAGDPFGDAAHYVVSRTLTAPIWRNTTIIRDNIVESIRALKAQPGKNILTDGSSQLTHLLFTHDLVDELRLYVFPLIVGGGKRLFPDGKMANFNLVSSKPLPNGVLILHYTRRA